MAMNEREVTHDTYEYNETSAINEVAPNSVPYADNTPQSPYNAYINNAPYGGNAQTAVYGGTYHGSAPTAMTAAKGLSKTAIIAIVVTIAVVGILIGLVGAYIVSSLLSNNEEPPDDGDSIMVGAVIITPEPEEPEITPIPTPTPVEPAPTPESVDTQDPEPTAYIVDDPAQPVLSELWTLLGNGAWAGDDEGVVISFRYNPDMDISQRFKMDFETFYYREMGMDRSTPSWATDATSLGEDQYRIDVFYDDGFSRSFTLDVSRASSGVLIFADYNDHYIFIDNDEYNRLFGD